MRAARSRSAVICGDCPSQALEALIEFFLQRIGKVFIGHGAKRLQVSHASNIRTQNEL